MKETKKYGKGRRRKAVKDKVSADEYVSQSYWQGCQVTE